MLILLLFIAPAMVSFDVNLEELSRVFGAKLLTIMRRTIVPLLIPGITSGWILMDTMFLQELSLSVVLARQVSEVMTVQSLLFTSDGLWGSLSAL